MATEQSRVHSAALAFRRLLTSESDRAAALMAGSYLDSQLGTLLRNILLNDEAVLEEVLGIAKPLGSFSSRIDVAYLLGVLSPAERRDLHLIRKIRNEFGHDPNPLAFDSQSIASRCRELTHSYHEKAERPRAHFTAAVMAVLSTINGAILTRSRIASGPDHKDFEILKASARAKAKGIEAAFEISVEAGYKKLCAMRAELDAQVQELDAVCPPKHREAEPDAAPNDGPAPPIDRSGGA